MPTTTKATQPAALIDTTTVAPTAELNFYYNNPRRGDIPAIARSLKRLKQYKPLTGNIGTLTGRPNEILAGNHTLAAIRELADSDPGDQTWQRAKVHWVDVDNEEARLINLTDNRTAELGGYDNESLLEALQQVAAVDLTNIGYSVDYLDELEQMIADDAAEPERGTGDKVALWGATLGDPPITPDVGSAWQMGHHTVVVCSLHKAWPLWVKHLRDGMIFAPYPSLLLPYMDVATQTPMLMVQPDPYIAGWLLAKWNQINPDRPAVPA